eukprot:764992-Hanusia_phi.AAC.4
MLRAQQVQRSQVGGYCDMGTEHVLPSGLGRKGPVPHETLSPTHDAGAAQAVKKSLASAGLSALLSDKSINIADKLRLILIYFLTMVDEGRDCSESSRALQERNQQQQENQGESLVNQMLGMADAQHYAQVVEKGSEEMEATEKEKGEGEAVDEMATKDVEAYEEED